MAITALPDAPVMGSSIFASVAHTFCTALVTMVAQLNQTFFSAPVTFTSATPATLNVTSTTTHLICNVTGTGTLVLGTASAGRVINVKTITANTVISASSNVCPIGSVTPGTAILSATAGKYALLVGDGTNWITMEAG